MSFTLFQNTKKCVKLKIKPKMTLNDLKWPLGDLCGKSWSLITKITMASESLTPKTYIKWCHLSFLYFLIFYLFLEVADFQGAGKIHSLVEKTDYNFFCVLWTQKGHKKQKLENEHENLAEWQKYIHYMGCSPSPMLREHNATWSKINNQLIKLGFSKLIFLVLFCC